MKIVNEFKNFAVKGNMIDIAIGIIMGTAFNKVIDIMVKNVIMPPFQLIVGNIDLEQIKLVLRKPLLDDSGEIIQPEVAISFGLLIESLISFLILENSSWNSPKSTSARCHTQQHRGPSMMQAGPQRKQRRALISKCGRDMATKRITVSTER